MKIPQDIRDHLIQIAQEHHSVGVTPEHIALFETVFNVADEFFINLSISKCAQWTLRKDDTRDDYCKKITVSEKRVLGRLLGRIKNLKK